MPLNKRAAVIGVNGNPGVGKTTVAALLSRYLGYSCVHLDDYLDPGKGQFVDNLDIASLAQAIRVRPIIIEGLCLTVERHEFESSTQALARPERDA